jgi:hypothetical protein
MSSIGCVGLASGLGLILILHLTPAASARTDDTVRALLLGAPEFIETHVTPGMLRLQQELVDTLSQELDYKERQVTTGIVRPENLSNIVQAYYRELETSKIIQARLHKKSISGKEILKIRITVRSDALDSLKKHSESAQRSYAMGVASVIDIAAVKAEVLKAEIMLRALRRAAR